MSSELGTSLLYCGYALYLTHPIAPTQTHIYLRAPRRFAHPAWAARQNLTRTLDGILKSFLEDAGAVTAPPGTKTKPKSRGTRTEGAWIGCRGGSAFAARESIKHAPTAPRGGSEDDVMEDDDEGKDAGIEEDEEDEEIWWAWDGKIVGFADW